MVSYFAPEGRSAEFYGIFAVSGRTSSFIGPTIYGFLAFEAAKYFENTRGLSAILAEQSGQRVALGSIVIFLVAGLLVLLAVKDPTKEYADQ
jgi:UMF1 family MFS transporter